MMFNCPGELGEEKSEDRWVWIPVIGASLKTNGVLSDIRNMVKLNFTIFMRYPLVCSIYFQINTSLTSISY